MLLVITQVPFCLFLLKKGVTVRMWMTEDCMRSNLMSFTFSCHDRRLFLTTIFCHRHSTSFSLKLYSSLWFFYPAWIKDIFIVGYFYIVFIQANACISQWSPKLKRWELGGIKKNFGWMENFVLHIMKFLIVCYLGYKIMLNQ